MGREAIFGSPYAHVVWTDPATKVRFHVQVDRGPETPFAECLQYEGLHSRWDSHSSGFGPYGQVRLAKHSGGIFFLLAGEEANLIGALSKDKRKFDDLAMKEYEPQLLSRREYQQARDKSDFRSTIFKVIEFLDPKNDRELNMREDWFPVDPVEFQKERDINFGRGLRALAKVNEGIKKLEQIQPLRDKEREPRWRAAYDLAYAQLLCFRVREFQYLLLLEKQVREKPPLKDPKSNEMHLVHVQNLLAPTPEQERATKVDIKELEAQKAKATEMFNQVIKNHPGTPWAQRAQQEKSWGFGYELRDRWRDPREREYKNVPKL
jgi:hypothetical protein